MDTRWQHRWTSAWPVLGSQLGFEIRPAGQAYDLHGPRDGRHQWLGRFISPAAARDEADHLSCQVCRTAAGTGAAGHRLVEGRGGTWDVDVALRLAEGQAATLVTRLREVSDALPEGPPLCVSLELIQDGAYVYREYLLVGPDRARAQHGAAGQFEAVVLTFEVAEVARVPDLTDTPAVRAKLRAALRSCLRPGGGRGERSRRSRPPGDLVQRVRELLGRS